MIAILIGNFANAQWQQCYGPYSGVIKCFASSDNIIFAGSSNGIYKSYNEGQSWVEVSNGLSQKKITSLAALGSKIFAATEDSGMFVSLNMGVQWMPFTNLPKKHISSIVAFNSKIYASNRGEGIFYSQDTGSTWIAMNSTGLYLNISDIAINDTAIFAATTSSGIYQSYDQGNTWQQSALPMIGMSFGRIIARGSKIVATSGNGVFISDNNGLNWNATNNDSLEYGTPFSVNLTDNYIFIGTIFDGLFRSPDNGMHWERINTGITSEMIHSLFTKNNSLYAGSSGGGIYKSSDNGINWSQSNQGINNSYVLSITGNGNNLYAVNWDDGLYKSTDNGVNWSKLNSTMNNKYIFNIIAKSNYVFALTNDGIYRSIDYGNNWIKSNNGIDSTNPATCITSVGNSLIAGREWGGGIFMSNNNGSDWILNTNVPETSYYPIKNFATNGDTVYALTLFGILKSSDGGLSWVSIYNPNPGDFQMDDICISGSNIILSKYPMIFLPGITMGWYAISSNNGSTWTNLTISSNYPAITSMVSNSSLVFASTSSGVFMSTNNGYNWIDITDNIDNLNTQKIIINNGYLYVSTVHGAVWRRPLSDFSGIFNNISTNYFNISLFPNPATNTLTLNLGQLKDIQNTTVNIYDIQGKLLLQQNIMQQQTELNISSFAKGIYIVKVTNDKETMQSKFVKE